YKDLDFITEEVQKSNRKIVYIDELEDKHYELKEKLKQYNISIVSKISVSMHGTGDAFIILGSKKSGNIYSSQDINVLEIVANELVVAIQNALHMEEIENFNLTLQEKVRIATNQLRKTNDKLRALDEAKDDFVSMASHQLRTPLTSVKGNISLVLDGDAGKISSLQRQMLEQAFGSSQRMVYLIADLLNVSRLKTGKFVIEPSAVNLGTVVKDEVSQLLDTAKSRNLTLNFIKKNEIDDLMLDETKTRQVIMNFIDNAIYYTPAGGKIDVYVEEKNNAVECRVVDNGIGVPKSEQHHLFTKFYRAGNARKARPDGTGLGLFMAKKVIVSEGGALIFETEEGKGSTFGFSFPKNSLAANQPKRPTPVKQPVAVP
ncbi:MAG: sensor histidine kinase, partial [Candidatus Saccharimonadales bacterium]